MLGLEFGLVLWPSLGPGVRPGLKPGLGPLGSLDLVFFHGLD